MKKKSDLIIIMILWIISIYSVIMAFVGSVNIEIQNYIGYGLLLVVSVLRYFKTKRIKTILGVILIFGTFKAIQFTTTLAFYFKSTNKIGSQSFSFGFEPITFFLLILLIVFNLSDFMRLIAYIFSEDPQIKKERKIKRIESLYEELKNENDSKLKEIIENRNMYQIEYVSAAERLIEERKNAKNVL